MKRPFRHYLIPLLSTAAIGLAQVAGPNINMVTGTSWPNGDPFLQRQNEPSMAVSSRNPLHLLAGANDYRTVDLPGKQGDEPETDAWLGVFKSLDGGQTWKSTLLPGYRQDDSAAGRGSPLKDMQAGADAVVRAGTNGLFYYAGLAFQRNNSGRSRIFVARYIDDNSPTGGDTIRYVSTSVVYDGDAERFEDKPAFAADVPRVNAKTCTIPGNPAQSFAGGRIYAAWTEFEKQAGAALDRKAKSRILFSYSEDCGDTWSSPPRVLSNEGTNQGASIAVDPGTGAVFVVWRVFHPGNPTLGEIHYTASANGKDFPEAGNAKRVASFIPFDQGTSGVSFRTNAYPSAVVVPNAISGLLGTLFVAWSQRTEKDPATDGDARIVYSSSARAGQLPWECLFQSQNPVCAGGELSWSTPRVIDAAAQRGHQFMPSLIYTNGKLTAAWYDHRDTNIVGIYRKDPAKPGQYLRTDVRDGDPRFSEYVSDPVRPYTSSTRRHTLDVRLAQATVQAGIASWRPSLRVSQYAFGTRQQSRTQIQQLELDPPNLPIFQLGGVPFIGDYIDVAGQTFVSDGNGAWRFNTFESDPEHIHVAWTDNRNVVQPPNGDWSRYTPAAKGSEPSRFDPSETVPACISTTTGSRNQDIYTARISQGLVAAAKTNSKPLGIASVLTGQPAQRTYPISVQNATGEARLYVLRIANQPPGGRANFLEFADGTSSEALVQLTVKVPAKSSVARAVFVTSTLANAPVRVEVIEVDTAGLPVANGARMNVWLNRDGHTPAVTSSDGRPETDLEKFQPDASNPDISNPDISNPDISNPDISNPDISNPDISNPDISNPDISNPGFVNKGVPSTGIANVTFANPDISNPDISNPDISNPDISNPDISNPDISNPDISNSVITDTTWAVTNRGNSAMAYSLKLLKLQDVPEGVHLQLLASKRYNTPAADGCALKVRPAYVNLLNQPSPRLVDRSELLRNTEDSPTISIGPGERILVTLRALDTKTNDPAVARSRYNPSGITNVKTANPDISNPDISNPDISNSSVWSPEYSSPQAVALLVVPLAPDSTGVRSVPLTILNNQLAGGQTGRPYAETLQATGGTPPYTWALQPGASLPEGITFSPAGVLSGTPSGGSSGNSEFGVRVTDASGRIDARVFRIAIQPRSDLRITTAAMLPGALTGVAYAVNLSVQGGTGPYTWSLVSGTIAPGLALSPSGALTGTPPASGTYRFTVRATDSQSDSDSRTLVLITRFALPQIATVRSISPGQDGIAAGSWIEIRGTGFANRTRRWNNSDFDLSGLLPNTLEGVSVRVAGIPAAVALVSFDQIWALCPSLPTEGPVEVQVSGPRGVVRASATLEKFAPAFFVFPENYVRAVHPDGAFAVKSGLRIEEAPSTRVARPGDVVMMFGSGFGATNPPVNPVVRFEGKAELTAPMTLTIGGVKADYVFAGISGTGLYQFNVVIPAIQSAVNAAEVDLEVIAEIGGKKTPAGRFITVAR